MGAIFNRSGQAYKRRLLRKRMTKAEVILWFHLKGRQLAGLKFRRQHGIHEYIVDFYCPGAKLAIELDGSIHQQQQIRDNDDVRDREIEQLGVKVLRFTNEAVFQDLQFVLQSIETTAVHRISPPRGGGVAPE